MQIIYFLYFLLKSDYKNVWQSLYCLKQKYNRIKLFFDAIWCSLYFGTSLDDYFSFRFYEKKSKERNEFASTLFMYKFHKSLNEKEFIQKIDNKTEFRKNFTHLAGTSAVFKTNISDEIVLFVNWLKKNNYTTLVIKDPLGTIGKSVFFVEYSVKNKTFNYQNQIFELKEFCNKFSFNDELYIEPKLIQHSEIQKLAPSALNTIRVITVLKTNFEVDIISAAFRISISGNTDNFSTGNLAAAIDIQTGKVITHGIKRMAACSPIFENHPVTGEKIIGFQMPMWNKVIEIVKEAAKIIPEVRTVGWDVAILQDKVVIIEGNPRWNKGAPQIPLNKGIKPILKQYLK